MRGPPNKRDKVRLQPGDVTVSGGGQQYNGQGEAACCLDKVTRGQEPAGALPGAARRAGGGKLPRLHHHRAPAPPQAIVAAGQLGHAGIGTIYCRV